VTQPPPQDPEPTLGRLAGSLGALTQQVADLRRKLDTQGRRLDTAGVDHLAVALAELSGRFEELAQTVTEALDAAAPGGPAAPMWDNMAAGDRARELTRLQNWVTKILVPHYCASGGYTMPPCWAEHTRRYGSWARWPPTGGASTTGPAPTSAWHSSSTTGGCRTPCGGSPT
jgi:hypothetical protein